MKRRGLILLAATACIPERRLYSVAEINRMINDSIAGWRERFKAYRGEWIVL